ncbi:DUF6930 domain-containing protein [Singulisphaera rosea]
MTQVPDRLILGKTSHFVKSRLSRLPRTDEVWEADIQPISVQGWNARRHGELWLGMVLTRLEDFHLALLAHEEAPTINDLANLLAKAMERPWTMGARRPARLILRNNPQWQELIPHLGQLKIEVETQGELPLWDDAAADYVRKLKSSRIGQEVPIITTPQQFDEAFPAVVNWVKTHGRIEIGVEAGQGFVVRVMDEEGVVFEGKTGKTVGEALTTLQEWIAQAKWPVQRAKNTKAAARRQPSRGRGGEATGAMARGIHTVSVPFSAAERRLILKTAKLDDEIAERLDGIDPREEVVDLTTAELVRLAIATAGDPTRLNAEADRNMWIRLSDRFHEAVGGLLRSDLP